MTTVGLGLVVTAVGLALVFFKDRYRRGSNLRTNCHFSVQVTQLGS